MVATAVGGAGPSHYPDRVNALPAPSSPLDELRTELAADPPDPARLESLGRQLVVRVARGDLRAGALPPDTAPVLGAALRGAATAGRAAAWLLLADCVGPHRSGFAGTWPDLLDGWPSEYAFPDPPDRPVGAALRCLDEAARLGDRDAALRFADAARFGSPQARRAGLAHLAPLLDDDPDGSAHYHCGLLHYHLDDPAASLPFHERAADAGNADAMFELYVYSSTGIAVDVDDPAAHRWLTEAAARRHPRALFNLGAFAARAGLHADAVEQFERAAAAGSERAAENLFVMHLVGDGVEADAERAAHWMRRAHEEGVDVAAVLEGLGLDPARTLREHGLTPVP
jgi:TPR repeat protein